MNNLNELLIKFNNINNEIIECLNNGGYEMLENLMEKKQEIINEIDTLKFDREAFINICSSLGVLDKQKECENLLDLKKTMVKEELKKISVNKGMNRQYNQGSYVDSIFFNKKI